MVFLLSRLHASAISDFVSWVNDHFLVCLNAAFDFRCERRALADFNLAQTEPIPGDWEAFARQIWPKASPADVAELRDHVSSYPERDFVQKYVHFVTCERIFKWLTEGEDRNRCFFWSATPYSSFEFFESAMRCPDEQKSYYGLYREFLLQLSPAGAVRPPRRSARSADPG